MPTSTWGSFCVKLSSACTRGRVGAPWAKKGRKSREVEKGQTPKFPRTPKDSHPGTPLSKERDSSLFLRSAYSPLSRPVPVCQWQNGVETQLEGESSVGILVAVPLQPADPYSYPAAMLHVWDTLSD